MISGWEWILVVLIVLAIFLWGPQKLPELARALGRAKKEFDKASKEYLSPSEMKEAGPSSDDLLIQTAKSLGIDTEGKTKEQLSQEIIVKANRKETKTNP